MVHATSTWFALGLLFAQPVAGFAVSPPPAPAAQATRIVAVVNGDVISNSDVDNRTRLFALSTGLPRSMWVRSTRSSQRDPERCPTLRESADSPATLNVMRAT